jgi:adenosine deaminase CECR1
VQYKESRQNAIRIEASMGFEFAYEERATAAEKKANKILQRIKEHDLKVYEDAGKRTDSLGQLHPRFYGDHFLSNVELIEKTRLFRLCQAMPKGAHLHIHFNANLHPSFLLGVAAKMNRMYIWSSKALTDKAAFDQCRIQFSILSESSLNEKNSTSAGTVNIFQRAYDSYPNRDAGGGWMLFKSFRESFPKSTKMDVDRWLQSKLVFHEEETHNSLQTAAG